MTRPCCAPVILNVWQIDQSHVQNDSQEALHLSWCDWLPLMEDGPWSEAVIRRHGLYGVIRIPVSVIILTICYLVYTKKEPTDLFPSPTGPVFGRPVDV